jgi:hypothetical protein
VSTLVNLSDKKIGDHTGETFFCFPSLYFFLSLISWVLFSESLGDPY